MNETVNITDRIAELRVTADLHLSTGEIDRYKHAVTMGWTNFAEKHQVLPVIADIDLWGFGSVNVYFDDPAGGWWVSMLDLIDPSGVPYERLIELFDEETEEYDEVTTGRVEFNDDGNEWSLMMVNHSFVMRLFACHSPWRKEFYENTKELMAHALEKSGLAAKITGSSETGFTALVHLTTTDGKVHKTYMPVHGFTADDVPLVRSPFDDCDDMMPVTDLAQTWELVRADDATKAFFGPHVDEETAREMAWRGPRLPDG